MVMRYLSTLTQEDSLRIQQQVEFRDRVFNKRWIRVIKDLDEKRVEK